jgi:hypothetical protein
MSRKIIESFSTWNMDGKEIIRKCHETCSAQGEMRKSTSGEGRERWGT